MEKYALMAAAFGALAITAASGLLIIPALRRLHFGQTIKEIQDETGRYVGCLEELGLQEGWITADHVHAIGDELSMTLYGKYLQCL